MVAEPGIRETVNFVRDTLDLVVRALSLDRGGAILVRLVPVQSLSAPEALGLIVVAEVVLVALNVVGQVDEVRGIVVQRALGTVALRKFRFHALLGALVVLESRTAFPFNSLSGETLDVSVT